MFSAVREDRMPGGRNSGAVYNLYKVNAIYRNNRIGRFKSETRKKKITFCRIRSL